jgi:class 3 adenylate cyclase
MTTIDPEIVDKLLLLLRQWGWETGSRQLEVELAPAGNRGGEFGPEVRAFFLGWMAAERGDYAAAERHAAEVPPRLAGWALFLRAFAAFRRQKWVEALALLDQAEQSAAADNNFQAAIAHVRGAVHYHTGQSETALALLKRARQLLLPENPEHFGLGRVLDTIGMIYASTANFHAAREFYRHSLELKRRRVDKAGEAVSNGQLGRLCLDWGLFGAARGYFRADLDLCREIDDERGRAQMHNELGRVALAEGQLKEAAEWLDGALRDCVDPHSGSVRQGWDVLAGFAHKDRALVHLAEESEASLPAAETHLGQAGQLFANLSERFAEGLAHVDRARGILARRRGDFIAAAEALREALRHFRDHNEAAETVRTQLEIDRNNRARGERGAPLTAALLGTLAAAEACRRAHLVRAVESELREVDPATYAERRFRRLRGSGPDDVTDLMHGEDRGMSALFLDIKNSTVFTGGHHPAEVMLTLNQLITELTAELRRHTGTVNDYAGDGFLALFTGEDNPRRAVAAALDMNAALGRFNEPREIIGLPLFETRIGISTGVAFLGNMGTYDKMSFVAVGAAVNLGARVEPQATPGVPSVSEETWRTVRDHFTCRDPAGRTILAKGFDPEEVRVWDITGRK